MRVIGTIAFLLLTACSKAPERAQAAQPAEITFEGAKVTEASARIAHGERLARVLGCRGCHGQDLRGQRFYELYASNLTRDVPKYSDAQLERLIRHGERTDGKNVWAMPSEIFQHLSDSDYSAVVDYLRSLKPGGAPTQPRLPWEPDALEMIRSGKILPAAQSVVRDRSKVPFDAGPQYALGRYITMVTCAECHGAELSGGDDTPDLVTAGGYSRGEFETLITKGVPTGGRKFKNPLMGQVARNRFSRLTPKERDSLYAYLKARAERPQ